MKQLLKVVLPITGKWGLVKNILLGLLSGTCGFLFINTVNRLITKTIKGDQATVPVNYIFYFAGIIIVFIWSRKALSLEIIRLSQTLFWQLRKELLSLVLKSTYGKVFFKKNEINTALHSDVNALTQASWNVIDFFTSAIVAISCFIYLATISFALFAATLVTAAAGIAVFSMGQKKITENFEKSISLENHFVAKTNDLLEGFKEIFLEPRKGDDLYNNIKAIAEDSYEQNFSAHTSMLNNQTIGQLLFYLLISSALLFFAHIFKIGPADMVSYVFTLIYLLGSITTVTLLLPTLTKANVAYRHIYELKKELEILQQPNLLSPKYILKKEFKFISLNELKFKYNHRDTPFNIGPFSFSINKGDVIFIYGANGSGKTTFIYCLLGLYHLASGEIKLNNAQVTPASYADYKTIFSVVFSDFYLFDELFGLENINIEKWKYYLEIFELTDKIKLEGKKFSTIKLSTGQKKRLALVAALMEEKPVLVLDEWAADQDPHFRKKFYTEIIPVLKQDGVTIIAISHDDKYYHCADRLYRMDEGMLIEDDIVSPLPSAIQRLMPPV